MICNDCKHYRPFTHKAGLCALIDLDWRKLNTNKPGALADAIRDCQRNLDADACEKFERLTGEHPEPALQRYYRERTL